MPPTASTVTASTADPREHILGLARAAFVEKGFDGASMQDLARAAGMSAGNFYRYFPSKSAIVEAFVAHEMTAIDAHFAAIQATPDPLQAIRATLTERIASGCEPNHSLWAEIMAAAHRRPEIAQCVKRLEAAVEGHIVRFFALLKSIPEAEASQRYATHARLVLILVRGAEMEVVFNPMPQNALTDMVYQTIIRVIDDVLNDATGSCTP